MGTLNTVSFDHVTLGAAPTVSLTVNPASVPSGGTTQLTWTQHERDVVHRLGRLVGLESHERHRDEQRARRRPRRSR